MKNKLSTRLLILAGVIVGLLLTAVILFPRLRPHTFHGQVLQSPDAVDFTLTAPTGERVSLSDLRGKWVMLYYGYTYCPDVCPTTLAQINQALTLIGDKAKDVQVIMVSVDPERDTPEKLGIYLKAFNPAFLGLTGSVEEVTQAAMPLGIYFAKRDVGGKSGYLVDHTASVNLVGPDGRVRIVWPPNTSPELLADDLDYMLR